MAKHQKYKGYKRRQHDRLLDLDKRKKTKEKRKGRTKGAVIVSHEIDRAREGQVVVELLNDLLEAERRCEHADAANLVLHNKVNRLEKALEDERIQMAKKLKWHIHLNWICALAAVISAVVYLMVLFL